MLTLFTTPKAFRGHYAVIQGNALRSWKALWPDVQVIVFGDEEGSAAMAASIGAMHQPNIARNEYGTPLLDHLFEQASQLSVHPLLCYINADILMLNDFRAAIEMVARRKKRFLMVGKRWDFDLRESLDFTGNWQEQLIPQVKSRGKQQRPTAIDYFVFQRGMWSKMPPFAVGRTAWDNWLIYRARQLQVPVIDASEQVMCVHQNHDYHHADDKATPSGGRGYKWIWHGPEAKRNFALAGGQTHLYTIWDATHTLGAQGLQLRDPRKGLGGGIWNYRRSSLYPIAS